jgi:hypothetical protein
VEFKRGGEVVALGALERSDALFSYVRITAQFADVAERSSSAVRPPLNCGVQIGDSADFRTPSDIEAGRYVIRVFATPSGGRLINAGEPEGLQSGWTGEVLRKGQRVGTARIERVQTGYSVLSHEVAPQSGDTLQLQAPPVRERMLATVTQVTESGLLAIRSEPDARLTGGQLVSVYVSGEVAAVAVVLDVRGDGYAVAVVLDSTVARPFAAGAALVGF